ncbi:MAG: TPM domain-containing protein [Lachnospiraceae bacterium]|nr:TPM domain-containing protein [Lachnospiraceae bacterium]
MARAEELWSEEYYRAHDSLKSLTDDERDELDEFCLSFMQEYGMDLALISVLPGEYEESSLQELAEGYYQDLKFGYGENKDCILFICDMTEREAEYAFFGNAEGLIPDDYLDIAAKSSLDFYAANGMYGVLRSGGQFIADYFEKGFGIEEESGEASEKDSGSTESDLHMEADWDESLLRVVDKANLFTDKEEQAFETRSAEIREEIEKDIVIVTDNSAGGKDLMAYADDFFDYGGYGCGKEHEGVCLFICMDPDDRGWWTSRTGPETMGLYSIYFASGMDAMLKNRLKEAEYAQGVKEWIENFYRLYTKGDPFFPDWLEEASQQTKSSRNSDALRIDDAAGVLSIKEGAELSAMARDISEKYGLDVVIHTTRSDGGLGFEEYAKRYCEYRGAGLGSGYDGIALITFVRASFGDAIIYPSGSGAKRLNAVNKKRLLGFYTDKAKYGDKYYQGSRIYLKKLAAMEKTGRVPRSIAYWICITVVGIICGGVYGLFSLIKASDEMEKPTLKCGADHYLVMGSLKISGGDTYINTTRHSRYCPPSKSRSGGGSGGSSYSSSHTSSSGRSHSGSGGRF